MTWFEEKNPWLGVPNLWLVIATVFVIFFTGIGAGLRARYNLPSGQDVLSGVTDEDVWVSDKFVRETITIDFEIDQSDWQAGGAVSPAGTPVYAYFYTEPKNGDTGIDITVAGEDITLKADNDGIIWIDAYGGSDYYLVASVLRGSNPEVKSVKIVDWDGDDTLDCLMKIDLSRFLKEQHEYKPTYVMEMPLLNVDVAGLDDDNPADQTALGTAQATITVTWAYTGVTAEDGYVISELYILTNDTVKGNDLTLKAMTISGTHTLVGGPVTLQPQHASIGGAYAAYYVSNPDTDEPLSPSNLIIFRDTNMGDTMYFSVQVQVNLETNDSLSCDIFFTLCSPDGTQAVETDVTRIQEM